MDQHSITDMLLMCLGLICHRCQGMPGIVSVGLQLLFITTDHYLTLLLNNNNVNVTLALHLDVVILT